MSLIAKRDEELPPLERVCCLAALIYLECCVREIHPRSRIVEALVAKLWASLLQLVGPESSSSDNSSTPEGRLLFWALVVGTAASIDQSEHAWFVTHLRAQCATLGVRCWADAEEIVRKVLWPEGASELTRALEWNEVGV